MKGSLDRSGTERVHLVVDAIQPFSHLVGFNTRHHEKYGDMRCFHRCFRSLLHTTDIKPGKLLPEHDIFT